MENVLVSPQTDTLLRPEQSVDGELSVRPPMLRTMDGLSVSGCRGAEAVAAAAVTSGETAARPWGDVGADEEFASGDEHLTRDWDGYGFTERR